MESDNSSWSKVEGRFQELMRERIRAIIETIIDEETLRAAQGAAPPQRIGSIPAGYRDWKRANAGDESCSRPPEVQLAIWIIRSSSYSRRRCVSGALLCCRENSHRD